MSEESYREISFRRNKIRKHRKQVLRARFLLALSVLLIIGICIFTFISGGKSRKASVADTDNVSVKEMLLTPNKYSRPQTALKEVNAIVIHYTANPGTDAEANRNYFNNLPVLNEGKDNPTYASSHYVIGLDGTIIQCIPIDEMSYASNNRNSDTISIECCHSDETGKFTDETYNSLIKLTAWLCGKFDIQKDGILRHYDVTGKDCPRYYVKHTKKWRQLKKDVFDYIENNAVH